MYVLKLIGAMIATVALVAAYSLESSVPLHPMAIGTFQQGYVEMPLFFTGRDNITDLGKAPETWITGWVSVLSKPSTASIPASVVYSTGM